MCIMAPVSPIASSETSTRDRVGAPHKRKFYQLPGIHIEPRSIQTKIGKVLKQLRFTQDPHKEHGKPRQWLVPSDDLGKCIMSHGLGGGSGAKQICAGDEDESTPPTIPLEIGGEVGHVGHMRRISPRRLAPEVSSDNGRKPIGRQKPSAVCGERTGVCQCIRERPARLSRNGR